MGLVKLVAMVWDKALPMNSQGTLSKLSTVVANAVFTPKKYGNESLKVPLLVLNPTSQIVTLFRGAM